MYYELCQWLQSLEYGYLGANAPLILQILARWGATTTTPTNSLISKAEYALVDIAEGEPTNSAPNITVARWSGQRAA